MSVAKTPDQKLSGRANIAILKARFAQDGHRFNDCIFNNDTMEIVVTDTGYYTKPMDNNSSNDLVENNNTGKMKVIAENSEDQIERVKEKMKEDYKNTLDEEKNLSDDSTKIDNILNKLEDD